MNQDNIILIGMPGSGKSTAGVVLAKFLGYDFVDTDLVIQEKTGKLPGKSIFEKISDTIQNRIRKIKKRISGICFRRCGSRIRWRSSRNRN